MGAEYETHYFDDDTNFEKGKDWYLDQMSLGFPDQISMEKTPKYFVEEKVPARMQEINKDMKLILVVRNPVERIISDYAQSKNKLKKLFYTKLFVLVLDKVLSQNGSWYSLESVVLNPEGEVKPKFDAVRTSSYSIHLRNWLKYFPKTNFFITESDQVVNNPVSVLYELETFLGIRHIINEDYLIFNKTKGFYCLRDKSFDPRMELVNYFRTKKVPEVKCLGKSKGRPHPEVDPGLYKKLQDYFVNLNLDFFNLRKQVYKFL